MLFKIYIILWKSPVLKIILLFIRAQDRERNDRMIFETKVPERIVDVHCHILPGVDDGSRSMEETINMLRLAQTEGITDMICTPHYKEGHHTISPEQVSDYISQINEKEKENGIAVRLFPGEEIYYFSGIDDAFDNHEITPMPDGEHILVEFPPLENYRYIRNAIDDILSSGLTPVIAHIERYDCIVSDIKNAYDLRNMGAEIQVNASGVTGKVGSKIKKAIWKLLKEKLVDYIGTDAHRQEGRFPEIKECTQLLCRKCDFGYASEILFQNAVSRLLNETDTNDC